MYRLLFSCLGLCVRSKLDVALWSVFTLTASWVRFNSEASVCLSVCLSVCVCVCVCVCVSYRRSTLSGESFDGNWTIFNHGRYASSSNGKHWDALLLAVISSRRSSFRIAFLPRDAMLARYMLSSCVGPSVRLSVTSRHCTKTAKHRSRKQHQGL